MLDLYGHSWMTQLGSAPVRLTLSAYPSTQPRLDLFFPNEPERVEITIEVPGYDLRSHDADYGFHRLHLLARSPLRSKLLSEAQVLHKTDYQFRYADATLCVMPIMWMPTPAAWVSIRRNIVGQS